MRDDVRFRGWWVRAAARGASPSNAQAMIAMTARADVRHRLAEVHVPTLVVHRRDNLFCPMGLGRYLGDHVPDARFVDLPGGDHAPWTGASDEIVDEIEEFLTGHRFGDAERVL